MHANTLIHIIKSNTRKKMSFPLMILSVILVVFTLTGSTNNYYNGKIMTSDYSILMDNIYIYIYIYIYYTC